MKVQSPSGPAIGAGATVVLADDHQVVRLGLRALLEAEPGLRVVGEAADGLEAVQLVDRLRPGILVLDLMLPGLNGLEVTRQVRQRSPQTRVIILSMHANEAYVLEALRKGAAAYVLKRSGAADLVQAVREVVAGRRYLSAPLSERAIATYVEKAEAAALDPYETLTTREREVLHLAAEGCTSADIAARLSLSPRTVEMHVRNTLAKLDCRSRTEATARAYTLGLVTAAASR